MQDCDYLASIHTVNDRLSCEDGGYNAHVDANG